MKGFIVTFASLLLLIVFPLQNIVDTMNHYRIGVLLDIIHVSKETARIDGRFTTDNINELKNSIMKAFPDISESDITIDVETSIKYKTDTFDMREAIYYNISVPIEKIVAANRLFGIPDEINRYYYEKEGYVFSEVLRP